MNALNAGFPASSDVAKAQAKRLRTALAPSYIVSHSQSLEIIAKIHGEQSWGRMSHLLSSMARNAQPAPAPAPAPAPVPAAPQAVSGDHIEQRALQEIWKGLNNLKPRPVTIKAKARAKILSGQRLISTQEFEAWLDKLSMDLGSMVFGMGVNNLLAMAKVRSVSHFHKPGPDEAQVASFSRAVTLPGFAAVLIYLERLGFDTHPELFVEPVLQQIENAEIIDEHELTCLWYSKEKGSFRFQQKMVDASLKLDNTVSRTLKLPNGLTVSAELGGELEHLVQELTLLREP
ncbi:glyoxalase superfamily protein [Leisingera sp. XS_AS12]|uniref:glyoxalase superfamily protein n=1 Tax=Leisingera sp. XS_AS12 TaxID=3241294 RepID=UPI0035195EB8